MSCDVGVKVEALFLISNAFLYKVKIKLNFEFGFNVKYNLAIRISCVNYKMCFYTKTKNGFWYKDMHA